MKERLEKIINYIKVFFNNFIQVLRRPEMIILPGNLSFFLCLSIIPVFSLISYGASVLNLSVDFLYDFIANSFTNDIADLILGVNLSNNAGIHFFITIFVGFYIASNGADSIITASNTIYGLSNGTWLKRRIKAFGLSFVLVVLVIFMLIVPVFGNNIISLFNEVNVNPVIGRRIIAFFSLMKGPMSWLIMFIIIKIIYSLAPSKSKKKRVVSYGALFTTVGWIISTKLYSIYVTNYASYQALYGGLASIVVLMIWIYFLSLIFTIGIALNCERDEMLNTGTINKKIK